MTTSITLSNSVVRSLNVATNPACHETVRKEHLSFLSKELWSTLYTPKYFDLLQEREVITTLYEGGAHERVWEATLPCSNCEVTFKFYNEFRGRQWCFLKRSIIIKSGKGTLVL